MTGHLDLLAGLGICVCLVAFVGSPGVGAKKHHEADVSGNFSLRSSPNDFCASNRAMMLGGETTTYPNQDIFCLLDIEVKQCVQLLQKHHIEDLKEFGCCRLMKNRCANSINCIFHKHCKKTIRPCVPVETPTTIAPCSPPNCYKPTCKPWCKDN